MTPRDRLVTVPEGTSIDEAREIMHAHKVERVLVLNDQDELKGLITVKDILKTTEFPNANKDAEGVCALVPRWVPAAIPKSESKHW